MPVRIRRHRRSLSAALIAAALLFGADAVAAEEGTIAIELNKLEANNSDCRAYFVIDNKNEDATFKAFKLDFVLFRPDGVIGQRFSVDLAPLKANKRSVKLFDIDDTACDEVGSFLINDVVACEVDTGDAPDCLAEISTSSRTENSLTK